MLFFVYLLNKKYLQKPTTKTNYKNELQKPTTKTNYKNQLQKPITKTISGEEGLKGNPRFPLPDIFTCPTKGIHYINNKHS